MSPKLRQLNKPSTRPRDPAAGGEVEADTVDTGDDNSRVSTADTATAPTEAPAGEKGETEEGACQSLEVVPAKPSEKGSEGLMVGSIWTPSSSSGAYEDPLAAPSDWHAPVERDTLEAGSGLILGSIWSPLASSRGYQDPLAPPAASRDYQDPLAPPTDWTPPTSALAYEDPLAPPANADTEDATEEAQAEAAAETSTEATAPPEHAATKREAGSGLILGSIWEPSTSSRGYEDPLAPPSGWDSAPAYEDPLAPPPDWSPVAPSPAKEEEPSPAKPPAEVACSDLCEEVQTARTERSRSKSMIRESRASVRKSLANINIVDMLCGGGNARLYLDQLYQKAEQLCLWKAIDEQALGQVKGLQSNMDKEVRMAAPSVERERVIQIVEQEPTDDDDDEDEGNANGTDETDDAPATPLLSASDKKAVVRRQSAYILCFAQAKDDEDEEANNKAGKAETDDEAPSKDAAPADASAEDAEGGDAVDAAPGTEGAGPSSAKAKTSARSGSKDPEVLQARVHLRGLLTAKKVDMKAVRSLLMEWSDASPLLEAPLDAASPAVPKPLVVAVGANDPNLVELLLEFKALVTQPYDGAAMYKGWVKPGVRLVESVQCRKGRFVGTMLADRLENIEMLLEQAAVEEAAFEEGAAAQEEVGAPEVAPESTRCSVATQRASVRSLGGGRSRISVKIETEMGLITHTQGHPREAYEIMEHLGDGDTSTCWEGFHIESHLPVAIKAEVKSDEGLIWEEINIMRKINHPNIVKLQETFESENQVFMVLELCEGGRLFDALVADTGAVRITARSARLMSHLAVAVKYLHSRFICHRDIQLENFLLSSEVPLDEATVKLIDFTTAKEFGPGQPEMKTKICTPSYVAREILTRNIVAYTEKVDIWSLGVVYFIMLCGQPPFTGATDFDILKKVKRGVLKFEPAEEWAQVPDEALDLVKKMINPRPEDRLSAAEVLEHPWLAGAQSSGRSS